jgi:23S rRNA (uracil1939-C5)-methyltransferase
MEHQIEITSLAHGGAGIGRIDGQVCFVPFALPGDALRVRVTRREKNHLFGEIVAVETPSDDRQSPQCASFGRCGACTWDHFAYPAQAEWKRRIAMEQLARLGGVTLDLAWVEDPALRRGYRTRAEFHSDGEHFGFYALGSHDIVDTTACSLCHPHLNAALPLLREARIKGSCTVTVNPEGEEVMVWTKFPQRRLRDRFPLANVPKDESPRAQFVFDGAPIVNGTFAQASLLLNRLLVRTVHSLLGKSGTLLDLYCGNGNLSIGLPSTVEVSGMDHNRYAVNAARRVSKREYRTGGEERMAALLAGQAWDAIVLDPPRTGAKALLPALAKAQAGRMVYVSCDAATLARDLKALAAAGWQPERGFALDLFPHTAHVELVVALTRG